ncbi:cytochrome b560 subunit of succinate dehydrogenase [Ascobolus immersus RN42]|uniref:Cytochrome b560 subunit of succinate dehydrogenase n=1 Tax=Ascobolus immersus RN42 TaxID=1160509 RepID=A0A3N4IQ07_ASCIM|nr:cytochrome b560 subunit of succinate dehydrogenase [Ascobolus immersus RN42]
MLSRSVVRAGLKGMISATPASAIFRPAVALQARSTSTNNTTATTHAQGDEILRAQRLKRPISPHLSIYQPQLTWYMSSFTRITGVALSGALYAYFAAYAASPLLGLHLESSAVAASFATLPFAGKFAIKLGAALPFAYHSWNGVRHLIWDMGKELSLKGVYRTGYAVLGLTVVTSVGLALM